MSKRSLPHAAFDPVTGVQRAMVRMQLPTNPKFYYRHGDPLNPWVKTGYTTWRIDDWFDKFGGVYGADGIQWEFFGEEIPLWEPNEQE